MINSKLPNIGTSIFAVMSKMAEEHQAINLSQGFPDFQCSEELIELVNSYMRKGFNQYAPMPGVLALREAIAEKTEFLYGAKYDPETEITVTAGATQALFTAITAFVSEGDEVIIFEPAYDSYVPAIKLNGGQPVYIEMKTPDFSIDWEDVRKAINSRTRMIILNTPHNPTGSVLSEQDFEKLSRLVSGTKIIILSDEVYEHIIFDDLKHHSISKFAKLNDRCLVISSFGKTYHTTGWKLGYCLAPIDLMKEFRKVHQFTVFAVNTPIQWAIAEFLKHRENYMELGKFYQTKRDYFINLLSGSKYKIVPAKGTYFQLLDYSEITDEQDKDFATRITKSFGVASIPISSFYHDSIKHKNLRFCFAKSDKILEQAADKLLHVTHK